MEFMDYIAAALLVFLLGFATGIKYAAIIRAKEAKAKAAIDALKKAL